jgi:antitoxin component YwqK of YwqJK toxin-antitoxin module
MKYFKSLIIGLVVTCFVAPNAHAQTNHWFKKLGFDSLLQIAYYVDHYERDEGFNGTYWTEGSRVRFSFPHGTNKFKTGFVKGWRTHRELVFPDENGNPKVDSVLWAAGQMVNFMRVGTWRKYHFNGKVALEVNYCDGQLCGVVSLYHETGAVKTTGAVDEKGYPHGLWRGEFPSGKPKFEVTYDHSVNIGWSKHYTEEGLLSEVHFIDNQWSSYYDKMNLYYPETGRLKARIERANQLDKIVEAWDEDGKQTAFNSSGSIAGNFPMFDQGYLELSLRDGRVIGEETRYYNSDKTEIRSRTVRNAKDSMRFHRNTFYRGGMLESEFSFNWVMKDGRLELEFDGPYKMYHGNGKQASAAVFKNGFLVDAYRHWNAAGTLVRECSFASENSSKTLELLEIDDESMSGAGVPNGICRYWNDAGLLILEESYKMGLRDGVWKTWHPNGVLASERTYENDKSTGKERFYDEQGKRIKSPTEDCPKQNWGGLFICSKHQNESVIDNIGTCRNCNQGTSSGMYSLCAKCACRLKQCQRCGRDL